MGERNRIVYEDPQPKRMERGSAAAKKRCHICGEKYAATEPECPFCKEDEAYWAEKELRRKKRGGKRAKGVTQFGIVSNALGIAIVLVAASLVYMLHNEPPLEHPSAAVPPELLVQDTEVSEETEEPSDTAPPLSAENASQSEASETDPQAAEGSQQTGETPDEGQNEEKPAPSVPETNPGSRDYETLSKLPGGLSLSSGDFTLSRLAQTHTLRASGGSNPDGYTWVSENEDIVSVDQTGKVKAISGGTAHILVTDGSKKAVCIVRVSASGSLLTTPAEEEVDQTASGLKAGAAEVINAETGVRVRSGPGTNYEALISIYNGTNVQVVKSAGDGWYQILYYNARGTESTGYMKGEFLKNT